MSLIDTAAQRRPHFLPNSLEESGSRSLPTRTGLAAGFQQWNAPEEKPQKFQSTGLQSSCSFCLRFLGVLLLPCKGFWALLLRDRREREREVQATSDSGSTRLAHAWPSSNLPTADRPPRHHRPEPRGKIRVVLSRLASGRLSTQLRHQARHGHRVGHGHTSSAALSSPFVLLGTLVHSTVPGEPPTTPQTATQPLSVTAVA